jgi:hypothetical protein
MPPFPIQRYLTPPPETAGTPLVAEGFTLVDERITSGLPYVMPLEAPGGLPAELTLFLPNGLAHTWREIDPATVVSLGASELAGHDPEAPAETAGRAPLWLRLRLGGVPAAVSPVVVGRRGFLPEGDRAQPPPDLGGVRVEVVVLDWALYAGTVRGAGDYGSFIKLAWRRADQAVARFSTPPVNPHVIRRLPPEQKMESELGRKEVRRQSRFDIKKVLVRYDEELVGKFVKEISS